MSNLENIKRLYGLVENKISSGYNETQIVELEKRLQVNLPKKLKEYYLALGTNKDINNSHNRLLKPNNEIRFSNDRYLIFYEENQAVASWGIKESDLKFDNPSVWGNYGTNELPSWHLEAKTTDSFFLLMAITNGTLGGLKYNAHSLEVISTEIVKIIEAKWKEITEISWNRQKYYTNNFEEVLSLSFDDKNNCTAIFIGTSNKSRFDNLLGNLSLNWLYISSNDFE